MKILSIECSATPCSVAVSENGEILASEFINEKLTHSQTLMPMVESVLSDLKISMNDIGGLAVSAGPGSFTGIRIGISAVKGLAAPKSLPCAAISTLLAMAYNYCDTDCIICAVMDARCNQVYTAFFENTDGCKVNRLSEDTAISIDELGEKITNYGKAVILVGDGAEICYNKLKDKVTSLYIAPINIRKQKASSVALCSMNHEGMDAEKIAVNYIRLPQAQRELAKKQNLSKN